MYVDVPSSEWSIIETIDSKTVNSIGCNMDEESCKSTDVRNRPVPLFIRPVANLFFMARNSEACRPLAWWNPDLCLLNPYVWWLHPPCLLFEPPFSWMKCCRIASFGIKSFKMPIIYIYHSITPYHQSTAELLKPQFCITAQFSWGQNPQKHPAILKAKVLLLCWGPARHQGWPPTISWATIAQWPIWWRDVGM